MGVYSALIQPDLFPCCHAHSASYPDMKRYPLVFAAKMLNFPCAQHGLGIYNQQKARTVLYYSLSIYPAIKGLDDLS